MDDLKNKIKAYLCYKGISHNYVAEQLGLSPQKFSNFMCGNRKISADEYIRLCQILGVSCDYFANLEI